MNRPDFREIRRLIDSLRALDQNFQQMFAQAQALEAEIQAVCARVRRVQAAGRLAQIPVEELRNARAGIRVSALEEAGYHTLLDLYQLHQAKRCYRPGDDSGLYDCMLEAKAQGKIRHIGITAHSRDVALEAAKSGLYETVQFPFSYLSNEKDIELVRVCKEQNVGFIAMKGLAGGLITHSDAAMAFMTQFDNVLPIWGIQRESELEEWLSYMDNTPEMTTEMAAFIEKERKELAGDFCRACGYCLPCPAGIVINQCARMSLLLRRMPSAEWLSEKWQGEMKKIENCLQCGRCSSRCPYQLNTPELLQKNYKDYQDVLAGKVSVD